MGSGPANHVIADATLPYRIDFENDASATAPAQRITVTDQLSPDFDWQSFRLTEVGFGDQMIVVPPNVQHFETTVSMTFGGQTFDVQIEIGLRADSGKVYASFQSIDPGTSLPPPVNIGFLPPEDGTGRGQGHFSYLINARTNLATGTQIRNVALIEFDRQTAIATNQRDPHNPSAGIDSEKEALVTLDSEPPISSVEALPSTIPMLPFMVSWGGSDSGSGIASYDVLVSTNGGAWAIWLGATTNTSALFVGEDGSTYGFRCLARDQVGNVEASRSNADVVTKVELRAANSPPVLLAVAAQSVAEQAELALRLIATDEDVPSQPLTFSLVSGPEGLAVSPSGELAWTPTESQGPNTYTVRVRVSDGELADAATFMVIVNEVNAPPVLEPVPDQVVAAGGQLAFNLSASDSDIPKQSLVFSSVSSPLGVAVSSSGLVTWAPEASQNASTNTVVVAVTDGIDSSNRSFVVRVLMPPNDPFTVMIGNLDPDLGRIELRWPAQPGERFRVEFTTELRGATWELEAEVFNAAGNTATYTVTIAGEPSRMFRVVRMP